MTNRRLILMGAAIVAVSACARVAHADAADDAFARGQALAEQGKLAEAEAAFEEAWAMRQAWDIAGNLGLVEAARAEWVDAATHLDFALAHIGSLAEPEHKAGLEKKFADVRAKVAELKIDGPSGASVKVGTDARGVTPLPSSVYAEPGKIVVSAKKDGFQDFSTTVDVAAGTQVGVTIKLVPREGGDVIGPGGARDERPIWPAVVLGGVAAVGVGVGVGLLVASSQATGDVEGMNCVGLEASCPPEVGDAVDQRNVLSAAAIPSLALGGVALGGMVLYLAWPRPGSADERPDAAVLPVLGPQTQGVVFRARF